MKKSSGGFTLIELVVVIVILGILAVTALPKYIDISDDALQAKVEANAGAFKSGINLANLKWRALGSPSDLASRNDVQISSGGSFSVLDLNAAGWPAQSWVGPDTQLSTNNDADCLSVFQALMQDGENKAATDDSKEFIANYEGNGDCSYLLSEDITKGFTYDSDTGEVVVI